MKTSTIALREQLLAALQTSELPLSTDQLAERMPPVTAVDSCPAEHCESSLYYGRQNPHIISIDCDGRQHTRIRHQLGPEVYPHLRAMERKGLCERQRFEFDRRVFWRYIGAPPVPVDELEAAWEATP